MVDAVMGSVILVVATTSLVYAVELAEKGFRRSGYQRLSPDEVEMVDAVADPSFPDADLFEQNNLDLFIRD